MSGPVLPPSFSRVSRGFEAHVPEPANAQLDAASWDGRGGCEADGVVTWALLAPTTQPACAGTPPRAGGAFILLGALSHSITFCRRRARTSGLATFIGFPSRKANMLSKA